jgi:hypothetical protein
MSDTFSSARFWSKVEKTNGCWRWSAFKCKGYGRFGIKKKTYQAHRVSAFLEGMLPSLESNLQVLHQCDNPACVRPDHLFVGTPADNMADKTAKGRQSKGASHGTAKLSLSDVWEIRNAKESCRKLAVRYGMSHSHIAKIKRGEIWKM